MTESSDERSPEEFHHLHHDRNQVVMDTEDQLQHSRAETALDESGYRGTTRGVVHHDQPNSDPEQR